MGSAAAPIMGMQGAGSLLSAYGQYEAGQSNAATLRMNADFNRTKSAQVMSSGEFQAGLMDLKEEHLRGAQESSYASQGVVVGAGTAGQVVRASEAMSAADKAMIRLNARRQAYGFLQAASSEDFQADMTKRSANMGAMSSLISGAGKIAFTSAMLGSGSSGTSVAPTQPLLGVNDTMTGTPGYA